MRFMFSRCAFDVRSWLCRSPICAWSLRFVSSTCSPGTKPSTQCIYENSPARRTFTFNALPIREHVGVCLAQLTHDLRLGNVLLLHLRTRLLEFMLKTAALRLEVLALLQFRFN